jgi:hypothetical protein
MGEYSIGVNGTIDNVTSVPMYIIIKITSKPP